MRVPTGLCLGILGLAGCDSILGIQDRPLAPDGGVSTDGSESESASESSSAGDSGASSNEKDSGIGGGRDSGGDGETVGGRDTGGDGENDGGRDGGADGGRDGGADGGRDGGGDSGTNAGGAGDAGCQTIPLTPDSTGFVEGTPAGIAGGWYAYGDGLGPKGMPGQCETQGMFPPADCSSITSPPAPFGDGGYVGFPSSPLGTMCLSGTAAKVTGTPPDYGDIYGIGMGLSFLNNPDGGTTLTYDAPTNKVVAFQFTVAGLPTTPDGGLAGPVHVELDEPATDMPPYDSWSYTLTANGPTTVYLQSGSGPGQLGPGFTAAYPDGGTQPPFDPTVLESIQFHVETDITAAVEVQGFCISDLAAIVCP